MIEEKNKKIPVLKRPSRFERLMGLAKRAGLDGFVIALIGMIVLAYLWPMPGVQKGYLSLSAIANYGVSLIFFFYGLGLNLEKLRTGLSNWRLHMVVHSTTFILFPLLVLLGEPLFETNGSELLWLGVFYLAALPSTVSSAVVMVSMAGGNIPAAIFNASISSLIGVFITPLWMGLVMQSAEGSFDFWSAIGKLILQVLVPVTLGIFLHSKLGAFAEKHRRKLRYFDQSIILLIVYTSFCESFAGNMFKGYSPLDILLLGACMIGLFLLVYVVTSGVSRLFQFSRADRITAVFCGSKKSLVHGTVMAKVLFSGSSITGIILLPIMLYHALQLIVASIIAQSMAQKAKGPAV